MKVRRAFPNSARRHCKRGMILSNEPGYYKTGAYGIRIENLVLVVAAPVVEGAEKKLNAFETLTLAPIDRRLIELQAADARGDRLGRRLSWQRARGAHATARPADQGLARPRYRLVHRRIAASARGRNVSCAEAGYLFA